MSTCHKCGGKLITVPVPDYPGKTTEICEPCNKKLSDSLFSGFTLAQVRHAHSSALNPPVMDSASWQSDFDRAWDSCDCLREGTTEMAARSWYTKGRVAQDMARDKA